VTDISRDGMQTGPNVDLLRKVAADFPFEVQASGGVAGLADLQALRDAGAAGAIVGKALWEGKIKLAEAVDIARG
jgi:phosphoribosylformimino-5-aminoimidazole carboxamide ribonucleotide (ProFAR) isomerase